MSRRRPAKPAQSRGPAESMMDFYLRNRTKTDASIDADLERSCTSKHQYKDELEARSIAIMQGMSGLLFTYHCRYCDFWHLTRRPTASERPDIIDE